MKKISILFFLALIAFAQTAWAQTWIEVSNASQLNSAIANNTNIRLTDDITLSAYLKIGQNSTQVVTIDLNNHTLQRMGLNSPDANGYVIEVFGSGTLTLKNGTLTGGYANNGGGICNYGTVTLSNVTITGCKAENGGGIMNYGNATLTIINGAINACYSVAGGGAIVNHGTANISGCTMSGNTATTRGGAIWNDGSLTVDNCSFTSNEALAAGEGGDGGAIHLNANTANLTNVMITNNTSKDAGGIYVASGATLNLGGTSTIGNNTSSEHGGGGIVNQGTTVLSGSISITGNSCHTKGAGLWSNGTLSMQGHIMVKNNNGDDIYLKSGKYITITGTLTGGNNSIGVNMEVPGVFTSGYEANNPGNTKHFFASGNPNIIELINGEDKMYYAYYECTWNATNKTVVRTRKHILEGQALRNLCTLLDPNHGGYLNGDDYWFVVDGSITLNSSTVTCTGSTVHLILCDNASFTADAIYVNSGTTLHIYSQSNGGAKGKIHCENSTGDKPGIGGENGTMGTLVIHGGDIYAKGGSEAAGIGGCDTYVNGPITIYDGHIDAHGGDYGAGIGTGDEPRDFTGDEGHITIYGGEVYGSGGKEGAGIGGGNQGMGPKVFIHGGYVSATGGELAAGIGGGDDEATYGVEINGGTINASGGKYGAGIGGGEEGGGGNGPIVINGGWVDASSGKWAAGIGGGYNSITAGTIRITGGRVKACSTFSNTINEGGAPIGSGGGSSRHNSDFRGTIEITGGNVFAEVLGFLLTQNGAGIGSGYQGDMEGTITISGGEVIALSERGASIGAGYDGESTGTINLMGGRIEVQNGSVDIDPDNAPAWVGHGANASNNGTLYIDDGMLLTQYDHYRYPKDERKTKLQSRGPVGGSNWLVIRPCTDHSFTYTIASTTQHNGVCDYCNLHVTNDHNFNHGECTVCHFNNFPNRFTTEGNWNDDANWSNGVPAAGSDVLLQAAATIPDGYLADAGRVFFDNCGSSVTIAAGGQLKLNDHSRRATVQKHIESYGTGVGGYNLIANPVVNALLPANLGMNTGGHDLYRFDQSEELEWRNYEQQGFKLENGKGYLYANSDDTDIAFQGTIYRTNADISLSLDYDPNAVLAGFNLVGNPFTCNAYLLDENNGIIPFFKMNDAGDTLVAAQAGTPIKPCEGVFVICPNDGQAHSVTFTTTAPATIGEAEEVPSVFLPVHSLPVHQDASLTNYHNQTITLLQGWNWFSTNLDITLDNLKAALVTALPDATSITIKSQTHSTSYNGNIWRGTLGTMDVAQMYEIKVPSSCTITLTGAPIDPSEHPVTIAANGNTWIGYPFGESKTLSEAFGSFPVNGDIVKSKDGSASYNGTMWRGVLTGLQPGQGYIYKSASGEERTFTFPVGNR